VILFRGFRSHRVVLGLLESAMFRQMPAIVYKKILLSQSAFYKPPQ
jgi:hypothetical protein